MITCLQNKAIIGSFTKQLRLTLAKGGDIADIEKIFQSVLQKSEHVNKSLKTQTESENEMGKSFLKFYETASRGELDEDMGEFLEIESDNKVIKTEAYYCTKHGRVKGILTVSDTYIMYDPLYCDENNKFSQDYLATKFQA
jgi:hypothetical protein